MDALVLLGSFALLMAIGVPIAFALGLAALIGALWTEIPLEAVMLRISLPATIGSTAGSRPDAYSANENDAG